MQVNQTLTSIKHLLLASHCAGNLGESLSNFTMAHMTLLIALNSIEKPAKGHLLGEELKLKTASSGFKVKFPPCCHP